MMKSSWAKTGLLNFNKLLSAALLTWPASAGAVTISELCAKSVEGSYLVTDASKVPLRINLICIESDRMVATLGYLEKGKTGLTVLNFARAEVDQDVLVLAPFAIKHDERKEISSKVSAHYLKLNLAALLAGKIQGALITPFLAKAIAIGGSRSQTFSVYPSALKQPMDRAQFVGSYQFVWRGAPAELYCDVLGETPFIAATLDHGLVILHFLDGANWTGDGLFSMVSPYADGEVDQRYLSYIRGRALSADQLEFYLIDAYNGATGPYQAHRN